MKNPYIAQMGVVLFLVGVVGCLYWYSQTRVFRLDHFFTKEATSFIEIRDFEQIKETDYPGTRLLVSGYLQKDLHLSNPIDLESWAIKKMALATFPGENKIWAFHGVKSSIIKPWMDSFLLEDEKFQVIKYNEGQLFMPSFSSSLGFGISGNWFFVSTDQELLKAQFRSESKLSQNPQYKKLFKDLPSRGSISAFFDTQALIKSLSNDPRHIHKKPIFEALSGSFTALGVSGKKKDGHLTFYTKMLVHEGVFHKEYLKKQKGIIPELASFVSQDGLFFMTGYDLYEKFQHSKTFLSTLNDQFEVIFEGVLRAKSQELFGSDFDFDKDFLSHMHGQYGVWVDTASEGPGGLQYVFFTGFGGADKEQSLSHLREAIQYAQSRFVSEVQVVELPDGTSREELVSVKPGDIPIRKVETSFGPYYTFERPADGKTFTFGFFNGSLVFSTSRDSLEKIVSVLDGKTTSLSENDDFRESVLFRYGPSESYGFINTSKIDKLYALISDGSSSSMMWDVFSVFKQDVRNISFARRVYPEEIFMTFTFFGR
ncbi:MAG TPA: hypothetical protein VIT68_03455 [Candidatus Gracilibacteria bacterium]